MTMHEQDGSGELTGTLKDLASDARCSASDMRSAINDLMTHQVAEVTERNGIVTLVNRKMRREYLARKSNQTRQQRYRERQRGHPDNTESNGGVSNGGHVLVNSPEGSLGEETKENTPSRKVHELFVYWQVVMNHPQAKLNGERERKIRARLAEGYSLEQLKAAVEGCRASDWHMGGGPDGRVFDDIELICRNASKVEQFLNINRPGVGSTMSSKERRTIEAANRVIEEINGDTERANYRH